MKITYNSDIDVLRIIFNEIQIEESDEEKTGVILLEFQRLRKLYPRLGTMDLKIAAITIAGL